nr:pof6 interactor protein 1 [Quercus suber]
MPSGDLDMVYAALNRQTLLKFYQDSWLSLVDAIASLIDEDSGFVFEMLDGKHATSATGDEQANGASSHVARKETAANINYREEPLAFFFVLFGLTFESLAVRTSEDDVVVRQRNLDILSALRKILRPSVSGNAIYQDVIFSETMDLLARMVLTETLSVQAVVVEIARNLCIVHPSSRHGSESAVNGDTLSDDIEQLFELTRIIVLVIANLVPGLSDSPVPARLENSEEATSLVRIALQALVDVSDVFPAIIKTDLHATILHIFVTVLATDSCQASVVSQALPIFRRFISNIVNGDHSETQAQIRNALVRMLIVLKTAQKRETEASLPCEKNTLLAITIFLSTAPQELPDHDPIVSQFAQELEGCLHNPLTSRVAAGCIRTLLLAGMQTQALLRLSLTFLDSPDDVESLGESRTLTAQSLTLYAPKVPASRRPAAIALFIAVLLARAEHEGSATHAETATRLLDLAALDNTTFRSVVSGMDTQHKAFLEKVLKARMGVQRSGSALEGERGEPTIALKMAF